MTPGSIFAPNTPHFNTYKTHLLRPLLLSPLFDLPPSRCLGRTGSPVGEHGPACFPSTSGWEGTRVKVTSDFGPEDSFPGVMPDVDPGNAERPPKDRAWCKASRSPGEHRASPDDEPGVWPVRDHRHPSVCHFSPTPPLCFPLAFFSYRTLVRVTSDFGPEDSFPGIMPDVDPGNAGRPPKDRAWWKARRSPCFGVHASADSAFTLSSLLLRLSPRPLRGRGD